MPKQIKVDFKDLFKYNMCVKPLQFYRDQTHADQVFAKMMQDETCGTIGKEFDALVTHGKGMITDGFRLRV